MVPSLNATQSPVPHWPPVRNHGHASGFRKHYCSLLVTPFMLLAVQVQGATVGFIEQLGSSPPYFQFTGSDFAVRGGADFAGTPYYRCDFCAPGTVISIDFHAGGDEMGSLRVRINGKWFQHLSVDQVGEFGYRTELQVNAGETTITGPGVYTGNVTFGMSICGSPHPKPDDINVCELAFGFSGSGQYEMVVGQVESAYEDLLWISRTTYFMDQAKLNYVIDNTVPEPSSVLLLTTGGGILLLFGKRPPTPVGRLRDEPGTHGFPPELSPSES